jgi:hypothetical protein
MHKCHLAGSTLLPAEAGAQMLGPRSPGPTTTGLSAWESDRSRPLTTLSWAIDAPPVAVMDPAAPGLMAREWPVENGPEGRLPRRLDFIAPAAAGGPARVSDRLRRSPGLPGRRNRQARIRRRGRPTTSPVLIVPSQAVAHPDVRLPVAAAVAVAVDIHGGKPAGEPSSRRCRRRSWRSSPATQRWCR